MTRTQVGRADLITAIGLQTADSVQAASLVGFELRDDDRPRNRHELPTEAMAASSTAQELDPGRDRASKSAARPEMELRTWRVVGYERLKPQRGDERVIRERPRLRHATSEAPPIAPLAPARSLLVRLRRIWEQPFARGIDLDAAIQRISRGEMLLDLPQRRHRKWGRRLQIIVDRSERLVPYWADQAYVVAALVALFPHGGVDVHVVSEIDHRVITAAEQPANWSTSHLLMLGDLGTLERRREGVSDPWHAFGKKVQRAGGRPLALVPCSESQVPPDLCDVWQVMSWERTQAGDEIAVQDEGAISSKPSPLRLLQILLAHAIRLEPGLVRQMRRILPSGSSNAALESLFWQDPAMLGTSHLAGCWHPSAARRLRTEFERLAIPCAEELRAQAMRVLESWRRHLPAEIFFEELLAIGSDAALIGKLGWQEQYAGALDHFRWLQQNPGQLTRGSTIVDWLRRVFQRLCDSTRVASPIRDELAYLSSVIRGGDPHAEQTAFVGESNAGLSVCIPSSGQPPHRVVAQLGTRNGYLTIDQPFWVHPPGPGFAKRCGHDAYGPWFEFEVETDVGPPVVQRMRWIPAGSFAMGSPESEEGRWADEGPQHQVTISRGFWIFDTLCTQQLWTAVMGENPSHFVGQRRPVERVSWNDAQEFTSKLQERIGLQLSLPTEAQWEYACRAGTNTVYCFGNAITRGDARYSESKENETAEVASYQPNDWGLFDMHGNVDEWCLDDMREYTGETARDPIGATDEGAARVFRGGSWIYSARFVRSACRDWDHPGSRSVRLGFRCVGVQSGAEPIETVRSERAERGAEASRSGGAASIRVTNDASPFHVPDVAQTVLSTDCERLTIEPLERPVWAAGFGRDRYGLWADLRLEYEPGKDAGTGFVARVFGRRRRGTRAKTVTQRLRWIPPGQFTMGSPPDESGRYDREGPQHLVTRSEGFWIFDTPCTQEFWHALAGENPSHFQDPLRPVESIRWNEASEFAKRLSDEFEGLAFDLPTEAQWEYACRAGTRSAVYTGDLEILGDANAPNLDPIAWYGGNSGVDFDLDDGVQIDWLSDKQHTFEKAGTRQVKQKLPNPWGLYDMLGNIWEWCRDGERGYTEEPVTDPVVTEEESAVRVIRGGSWFVHARFVRAAYRGAFEPGLRFNYLGFRCVAVQSPSGASASRGAEGRGGPKTRRA